MKLALCPMATLSHEALRVLIHRYGDPDEYFSEMIHAPSFIAGGPYEQWFVRTAPVPDRMVWQLTGSTSDSIIRAAEMILPYGGIGIDINMGCSAPDIARHGAGIAWMSKPLTEVAGLVSGVRRVIDRGSASSPAGHPSRLSVKLRLGEDEDYDRLLAFCRMLVEEGSELITLHPRVRRDKYGRPARRAYVARLASDLTVPVYGNGDVDSPGNAIDYMEQYPCAGLMLGRYAVQKPWIFGSIRQEEERRRAERASPDGALSTPAEAACSPAAGDEPPGIDHLEVSRFFLDRLAESQPADFQVSRAHRFFFYYCDNFSFAHHIKMKIQNTDTVDEIRTLLAAYFEEVPGDRYGRQYTYR